MSLFQLILPGGGKPSVLEVEQTPNYAQYAHITNMAIPHRGQDGPHAVTITADENELTIGTLDKGKHPQHGLDFIIDQTVTFKNYGSGPVHLLGYMTVCENGTAMGSDDEDEDEDDEDFEFEEDEDEDEDEGDDDDIPSAVPLVANGVAKAHAVNKKRIIPVAAGKPSVDEEDDDDDDDEDEDEDMAGGEFPMNSDDEVMVRDEGEDDDDEDEEDEDLDDFDGEGEEDEDEDEEGEEEEEEAAPPPKAGAKRVQQPATTPVPAKKAKTAGGAGVPYTPATAPAKMQGKGGAAAVTATTPAAAASAKGGQKAAPATTGKPAVVNPKNEKEFEAAVVKLLRSQANKSLPLAQLGSQVHRPQNVPKLGAWLKGKPNMFKVDANNNVVLQG